MDKNIVHKTSLELLDEFIASVSPEELEILIEKHQNSKIEGPTFYEYLNSLDEEVTEIYCTTEFLSNDFDQCSQLTEPYYIEKTESIFFGSPPSGRKKRKTLMKKGSVILPQSLFF